MKDDTIMHLTMAVDSVAMEISKLTQEVIKLQERIEDATSKPNRK